MAVTATLTGDRGRVRFRIGDRGTRGVEAAFDDEEIDFALTEAGSVIGACGMLINVLLAERTRRARLYGAVDGAVYDDAAAIAGLQALAKTYGVSVLDVPTVSLYSLGSHPSDPESV